MRILAIGEVGDRPREHCTFMLENVIKKNSNQYNPVVALIKSISNYCDWLWKDMDYSSKLLVSAKFALSLVKLFVNKHHSKMSSRHYVWLKILNINLLHINQTHQINFVMKFKLSLILFSDKICFWT